jgi:hypothetical protein
MHNTHEKKNQSCSTKIINYIFGDSKYAHMQESKLKT